MAKVVTENLGKKVEEGYGPRMVVNKKKGGSKSKQIEGTFSRDQLDSLSSVRVTKITTVAPNH